MKWWIIGVCVYLFFTLLQLLNFAVMGAGLSESDGPSNWELFLSALGWPIYWLKVWLQDD